jgi:hypothetical protein
MVFRDITIRTGKVASPCDKDVRPQGENSPQQQFFHRLQAPDGFFSVSRGKKSILFALQKIRYRRFLNKHLSPLPPIALLAGE